MLPLGGGKIMLSGAAVVDCARAVTAVIESARRRDAITAPRRLVVLSQALNAEAAEVLARARQNVVAQEGDPSLLGQVDVAAQLSSREVAALLGVSLRTVQRLAPELGARRMGGRWWFDPGAVTARTNDRKAA